MIGTEKRHNDTESDVVYQELQLNAAFDRFDLVAGFRISRRTSTAAPERARRITRGAERAFRHAGRQWRRRRSRQPGPNGLFVAVVTDGLQDSQSLGAFANLTWHITDRLNLTPGVRYAIDEKEVSETRFLASDFAPADGLPRTIFATDEWDNTDWRLTLDYEIGANHMLYVTASEAFRSGAYSYNINPAAVATRRRP